MKINNLLLLITIAFALTVFTISCKTNSKNTYFENTEEGIQTGGVKVISINTPKGKFKVWTKRMGNNPTIKVLLLNGGPGGSHDGFECFENFFPKEGIEFIYYDQLACGYSDNPKDTSLYDLPRYVEEVEQVRQALHLDNTNFYLLGHSWGGILAMQYALKYQDNLKGLIISNMMASCPEYGKYADNVLAKQMPLAVLDSIRILEKNNDFQNPKYMELLRKHFYSKHELRLPEWPESFNRGKWNNELYVIMQGPSEFGISGKLANWDVSKELKNIKIPSLVIGATYDTMDPKYMEWMSKEIPKGEFLLCPNGSHICFYDDQQNYFKGLIKFIKKVDGR
jgi:proline iminopeptidase